MKNVISISESLKTAIGGGDLVHATADARYDETTQDLTVDLHLSGACAESKVVTAKVSLEEAVDTAKDIFRSWVRGLIKKGSVCVEGA